MHEVNEGEIPTTMRPQIGWKVHDCYIGGIGELSDICCEGIVEAVGEDWVIVREL